MAHRQSYRKGPATATPSTHTPVTDHDGDNIYQDSRDIQQIADDSVAFLRSFSLRLQRFRAQVGEFAHTDHSSPHTDEEMADNDSPKPTTTMAGNTTEPNEPPPTGPQENPRDEPTMQTCKTCDECTPFRTELPDTTTHSPTIQTNWIPPCLDYTPDQPVLKDTYATTRRFKIPPSLRGTYVDEYLKRAHTAIKLVRDDPHLYGQPIVVDSNGGDTNDEFNYGLNTIIDRPAPCEPETVEEANEESTQPAGNTQRTTDPEQKIHNTTPPRQPGPEPITLSQKRIKHITDSQVHPVNITRNHRTDLLGHKEAPTVMLITTETKRITHARTKTEDTTEQDIEGLVPDRGKKPRYRTRRVSVSVIYMPTQGPHSPLQ